MTNFHTQYYPVSTDPASPFYPRFFWLVRHFMLEQMPTELYKVMEYYVLLVDTFFGLGTEGLVLSGLYCTCNGNN